MSTLAVRPVDAEWLEAVYKITGTALPETNGTSSGDNTKLKKKLESKHGDLTQRLKAIKGMIPPALRGKLEQVDEDLKAGYKISALENRLKEIETILADVEENGWEGDSQEWADEIRLAVTEFEKSCKEAVTALVKRAQQRAQALAETETDPLRKKRLIASASEAKVDFISVPIAKIRSRFGQDLSLAGEKKKNDTIGKYRKELQDTRADLERIIDSKRFVNVVRREQKPKEKEREANAQKEAIALVRKKIAALRELDSERAKLFEAQLKSADSKKTVDKIDTAVELALRRLRVSPIELSNKQNALGTKAQGVTKARKGAKGDRRAKLKDLENTTKGTQSLVATGNRKVIEAAEKLAEETSKASSDPNVAKFFASIDDLKKELDEKNLKLFHSREQPALLATVQKLGQEADPLDLEDSQLALGQASEKVKKLIEQTKARIEWQKSTKLKLQPLYARIAHILDEGMFITGKAKKRGIVQKWKEINATYTKPDAVMKEVDKEIAKLQQQADSMFNMKNGKPPNKAGLEQALKTDKIAGDKLETQRKDRSTALKNLNDRRKKLVKAMKEQKGRVKGDPALEDAIALTEELLKSAKQMGKAKQLEDALKKVDAAEKKLNEVKTLQSGADDDTVIYLRDKAAIGWNNAIAAITKKIEEIEGEALKVAGDNSGKVTTIIKQLTDTVFSPTVFTSNFQGPIKALLAAPDEDKKKAAREKVISEIRYIRKQLESNEVLMQLRVNPFSKRMATTPVTAFLDELEFRSTKAVRGK